MKRSGGFILILVGIVLVLSGLGLAAYNFWDQDRAGEEAQAVLEELVDYIPETKPMVLPEVMDDLPDLQEIEYPNFVLNPKMDMPIQEINGIEYVGYVEIPALGLKLPVISNWSEFGASIAPCRYVGTAYMDNMVICGHNFSTHFGRLNTLNPGDLIYFRDMDGNRFVYRAVEFEVLKPTDVEAMCVGEWDLTLFTCTLGGQTRFTVRCEKFGQ